MGTTAQTRQRAPRRSLVSYNRISELELRIAQLERERSAWEQERAAWMLAAAARPLELVLSLPALGNGLGRVARRVAGVALAAVRQRLPV